MGLMPVTDAMFLIPESREQPMHVGSLQLFRPPEGSGPDYLTTLYEEALQAPEIATAFRRRPHRSLTTLGQWTWVDDEHIDLEHHVRHSALPPPGRVRELLALVSRLHGTLLDRHRPLWEAHLIEGLADGRFAVYTKLHHAVMDGISALRLLERSLSTDPDARDTPMPFAPQPKRSRPSKSGSGLLGLPAAAAHAAWDLTALTPRVLKLGEGLLREQAAALPMQAPRSILNVPITGSRRFAAESWSLDRIKAVGTAAGATLNDVLLAMCSSALRNYLQGMDALPDRPLIAMTPVSLRGEDDDDEGGGNAVGTILCNLATDVEDPEARLMAIRASMLAGKAGLAGLSQLQVTALSAAAMAPMLLGQVPGISQLAPPAFNIVISNVPGPKEPLYWNGAHLEGMYPLSIPLNGQALNITVTSYAGQVQFGLTGCRRTLPHLQRLLIGLEDALVDLEKAFG